MEGDYAGVLAKRGSGRGVNGGLGVAAGPADATGRLGSNGIKQVLLISIDGMHTVDFINRTQGVNGGIPYCRNPIGVAVPGL
jgi:hypothetical protein